MTHFKKTDKNQQKIVQQLRDVGFSVQSTHTIGSGFPDLIVGKNGVNILIELKSDEKKKLRPGQQEFFLNWKGHVAKAHSFNGIVKAYNSYIRYLKKVTPGMRLDDE